ncbi:hypothetical protein [Aquipseudomonas campi]
MRVYSLSRSPTGSLPANVNAYLEDYLIDAWLMGGIPGQPDPDTPDNPEPPVEPGVPTLPDPPPPTPVARA